MGKIYDDVDVLLKALESDVKDVLMGEVLDTVKDIELKHIEQDVLKVYIPTIYQRRTLSGINDPNNIVGTVNNMELEVENITLFASGYGTWNHGEGLAELINDGNNVQGYFYDYPGEFNQPRPFLDNTANEIEQTDIVEEALKKGLVKRKWEVR